MNALRDLERRHDGPIPSAEAWGARHGYRSYEIQRYGADEAVCWGSALRFMSAARRARKAGEHARAAWLLNDALAARARAKFNREMRRITIRCARMQTAALAQEEVRP